VGNLSVPDPRVTNPELFDLRNPNAPIPQFVNAMKMAGIEITAEQVAQGITYEALKDKEGNPFVVAVYNLNPSLLPQEYRALAGPIPLMIAEKGENGWGWKEATLKNIGALYGIDMGGTMSYLSGKDPRLTELMRNQFSIYWTENDLKWANIESTEGTLNPLRRNNINMEAVSKFKNEFSMQLVGHSIINSPYADLSKLGV